MIERRVIIQAEDVFISLRNLQKGSEISSSKFSGEIVVNDKVFSCILMDKVFGRLSELSKGITEHATVSFHEQAKTKYTKNGYVVLLLTFSSAQIWIYIKRECLGSFYNAILLGTNN